MTESESFFVDGAAYERLMGRWSRAAGEIFLDWLSLPTGLRWLDVGCGTGAFTDLVLERCAPGAISGVDPAEDQLAYARERPAAGRADFRAGDALSLPFGDDTFDVAAMALVISFLPDRAKAVAEMKRVVRPGGTAATYMWDGPGKRHTQQPFIAALEAMGIEPRHGPGRQDARIEALAGLFDAAGFDEVVTRPIDIRLSFEDFDAYWSSQTALPNNVVRAVREMSEADAARFKASVKERLPTDADGGIAYMARANAVKGRVPPPG